MLRCYKYTPEDFFFLKKLQKVFFSIIFQSNVVKPTVRYPEVVSQIGLVEEEGNQVASGHLSTLDEQPAVVQHDDLHGQPCQLHTHTHTHTGRTTVK